MYVTVTALKIYKDITLGDTDDDARIWHAIRGASAAFDRWTFRRYEPTLFTRRYDHPGGPTLRFRDDLLDALEVKTRNGETDLLISQYLLKCGGSYNLLPFDRLELVSGGFEWTGTPQASTSVKGIWGFHPGYPVTAWEDSGDAVQGLTGRTLTVSDAGAKNYLGAPVFQPGQLFKIGSEFLRLLSVDSDENTLNVQRAVNGTEAEDHEVDSPIYIWRVWDDVWEAVLELAAYLYDLKDSQVYDVTATPETGMMVIPKGIPAQVRLAINAYRRREIG